MEYSKITITCVYLFAILVCQNVAESSQKEFNICESYNNTRALLARITNPDYPAATVSARRCQCRIRFAHSMSVTSRLLIIVHQGESFPLNVLYKSVSEDGTHTWPGSAGISLALNNDTDGVVIAENASYVDVQLDTLTGASRLVFQIEVRADTEMLVMCRDNSSVPIDNSSVPTTTTPAQEEKDHLQSIGEYCSPQLVIILGAVVAALLLIILVVSITLCCVVPKKKKEYIVQMRRSMMMSSNVDIPKSANSMDRAPTVLYDDAEVVNILKKSPGNSLTVPAVGYTRISGPHYANTNDMTDQYANV